MIVACPSCSRKYRLDESVVKARFQKMRCSRCGHVFVYESGAAQFGLKEPETYADLEMPPARAAKKRRLGLIVPVIVVVALVIAVLSGHYYWKEYAGASDRWLAIRNMEGRETPIKDGKIFLVRGVIANDSTKARKYVILKAKLFNDRAAVMGEHFALAGLPLSAEEVREMSEPDIEKKISDFRSSDVSAFVVQSGAEAPFSIVFPDTYKGTPKEFTVEVVESPAL